MNPAILFDLVIGFGVSFFTAQGNERTAGILRKLQAARVSGANIDAHMARVAESLIQGTPLDWEALEAEIDSEVEAFLARD